MHSGGSVHSGCCGLASGALPAAGAGAAAAAGGAQQLPLACWAPVQLPDSTAPSAGAQAGQHQVAVLAPQVGGLACRHPQGCRHICPLGAGAAAGDGLLNLHMMGAGKHWALVRQTHVTIPAHAPPPPPLSQPSSTTATHLVDAALGHHSVVQRAPIVAARSKLELEAQRTPFPRAGPAPHAVEVGGPPLLLPKGAQARQLVLAPGMRLCGAVAAQPLLPIVDPSTFRRCTPDHGGHEAMRDPWESLAERGKPPAAIAEVSLVGARHLHCCRVPACTQAITQCSHIIPAACACRWGWPHPLLASAAPPPTTAHPRASLASAPRSSATSGFAWNSWSPTCPC